ncbi:MAG: IS1595 family transposase [Leptospirillum sp.]
MESKEFQVLLKQLASLSSKQRRLLEKALISPDPREKVREILEKKGAENPVMRCPHCGGEDLYRWGVRSGLQRYRCRACRKTSNALTGSPLARLRYKEKWLLYAEALKDGLSVRKAAKRCSVCPTTTFRWRHRFLKKIQEAKDTTFRGIVEADETVFLESCKRKRNLPHRPPRKRGGKASERGLSEEQIPVLIVRDRHGSTTDAVLPDRTKATLAPILTLILKGDALLCTDGALAYKAVAREYGIPHQPVNLRQKQRVRQKVFHVQNVNAYSSRLKEWMRRFHGVATKYLPNYLGWRRMLEKDTSSSHDFPERCLRLAIHEFQPVKET